MSLHIQRAAFSIPPCPGGEEIHIRELTRHQVSKGHSVHVFFRNGDSRQICSPSTRVRIWPAGPPFPSIVYQTAFSAKVAHHLKKASRPDVVHVHGDFSDSDYISRFAEDRGIPLVLTLHARLNMRHTSRARRTFARVAQFITLGNGTAEDLARLGVKEERITVMSSGIDLAMAKDAVSHTEKEPGKVVAVGSLLPYKNFETVINAFRELPSSVPSRLVILGDGPLFDSLRDLASGDERIQMRGRISREEVYREVASSEVFVMASKRTRKVGEGIPTALLEAMALANHCLVSTDSLPAPVVTDEDAYSTFDPGDARQLTTLLDSAIVRREESSRKARAAVQAVSHLDWAEVADRVESVYDRAISARHEGG